jgi:predicted enzyme related to lactoylglutathione lyase
MMAVRPEPASSKPMTSPLVPGVGEIPSADIAVPQHDRELAFYARVLTTGDAPLWRDDLMNAHGTPVIGLGERVPEYESLPLQWMAHIQVADVAASVARGLAMGATELWHGRDDAGRSQGAVLVDAGGAAFGMIPVVSAEDAAAHAGDGRSAARPAGRIASFELLVADAGAARDFYRDVIGWSVREVPGADGGVDYELTGERGVAVATIRQARGVEREVEAVWLMHLPVGDLAASLAQVEAGGGEVVRSVADASGKATRAVIRDPVGVCLAIEQG